jgi:hypothetical protein
MFSLTQNRVHTEKPFFLPSYQLFDMFYKEYFILHPSLKKIDYFEIGLCGKFMRENTWDIDIRLLGNPKECDYDVIADFFRDVVDTGLNKYRIFIDIHCLSTPNSISKFNNSFNSNETYLYVRKYVDHLKQHIRYDEKYYRTTDFTKSKINRVSDNLWEVIDILNLNDYISKKRYEKGKVPHMVEISKYKELKNGCSKYRSN